MPKEEASYLPAFLSSSNFCLRVQRIKIYDEKERQNILQRLGTR
jgi:hypothetical protein